MNLFSNYKNNDNFPFILPSKDGYSINWNDNLNGYDIKIPNGELFYAEDFFDKKTSDRSVEYFLENNYNDAKTINWRDFSNDSNKIEDYVISFESDSSFYANMKSSFLDDSFGTWNAETCGFESWGELHFLSNPHEIQFAQYRIDYDGFCIMGRNRRKSGSEYIWFKHK